MKICSFLPSATEMVYALGLADRLVGVSDECNHPPEARDKPVVVRSALNTRQMTSAEVDAQVAARLRDGQSLYTVDTDLLQKLRPDLIITQALCNVCAPSGPEAAHAFAALPPATKILTLTPHSLADIFDNILAVGEAAGATDPARALVQDLRRRLEAVRARTRDIANKPRVCFLEWLDPLYSAGHWIPEMIEAAGGLPDALSGAGKDSVRVRWEDVRKFNPDILICSPCGYDAGRALQEVPRLNRCPGREDIPAFRNGRVYAVDADAYFARPGPRVVEGVELLAHLIHPALFPWTGPARAFLRAPGPAAAFSLC